MTELVRPTELERFSSRVSPGTAVVHTLGAFEREVVWQHADRQGASRTIDLRQGMTLSVSQVKWERAWSLAFAPDASRLKFIVARGPGPRVTPRGGEPHRLTSGTGHVSRVHASTELSFEFGETFTGQPHEELCLEIGRERLCELMGTAQLCEVLEGVWSSSEGYPFRALAAPAVSFRLLDEIGHCDARGASRQLHLEAKGLELLSAWVDQFEAEQRAHGALSVSDVERLEHARSQLLQRMSTPPRLPELARLVGLNEAKLKAGFRLHFGETVYGYLRQQRMIEAHRLLRERRYTVTEVAWRVGYANPSKFAAAFKDHFGVSPSQVT